jgi:hypothetical protein
MTIAQFKSKKGLEKKPMRSHENLSVHIVISVTGFLIILDQNVLYISIERTNTLGLLTNRIIMNFRNS